MKHGGQENFPGRSQVLPALDFGLSSKQEYANRVERTIRNRKPIQPEYSQCNVSVAIQKSLAAGYDGDGTSSNSTFVLLSRFRPLLEVCYYDNACSMLKSIILRTLWVNDECLIVCDVFHYREHSRNSICDPGSYMQC